MITFISGAFIIVLSLIILFIYYLTLLSNKMYNGPINKKEAKDLIEQIKLDESNDRKDL